MSERANCWSITINNPSEADITPAIPPSWKFEGQIERGEQGTTHLQGMLSTPQVRFSQVKSHFPTAHIEVARDKKALRAYVHKADTRIAEVPTTSGMNVFVLQNKVCTIWDYDGFRFYLELNKWDTSKAYLAYADACVKKLISQGEANGIEYVAINPMWRSAWKYFGENIIARHNIRNATVVCPPREQDSPIRAPSPACQDSRSSDEDQASC